MGNALLGKLPPMKGKVVELVQTQNVRDIITGVLEKHGETKNDYDLICSRFYKPSTIKIAKDLWQYCKDNMPYREESVDLQTVRTPAATIALSSTWGVDCKHYAGFIAGVLDALNRNYATNIDWCYRFASYEWDNKSPGHVFVVVDPGGESEIWIDPVLKGFNIRNPYPSYITDKKTSMALVSISGVNRRNPFAGEQGYAIGSANDISKTLITISPAVAAIPVVGWIGAAATQIAGILFGILGNKFQNSSEVRLLIERYMYKVLGIEIHSRQKVDESLKDQAQTWHSMVLGVPIYDDVRVRVLRGEEFNGGTRQNPRPIEESVDKYLEIVNAGSGEQIEEGFNLNRDILRQAALRARTLLQNQETDRGGWANLTAAPALVSSNNPLIYGANEPVNANTLPNPGNNQSTTTTTTGMDNTTTTTPVTAALGGNALTMILLGGALIFGLYEASKKPSRKVGKAGDNTLLYVGLGVGAVLLLMKRSNTANNSGLTALQQQQLLQQQYAQQQQQQGGNFWSALPSILNTAGGIFESIWG